MSDTRLAIVNAGLSAAQADGYDGLVFRDLAAAVGVTNATVHHHFATKAALGVAIANRQLRDTRMRLDALSAGHADLSERLAAYPELFRTDPCDAAQLCLYTVMMAQHRNLPDAVLSEVQLIADAHLTWLSELLREAEPAIGWAAANRRAQTIYAAMSGVQLVARAHVDASIFDDVVQGYRDAGLFQVCENPLSALA